eukprot:TRINITY_DN2714_c0_g2_i3.p1 TRINITY_DN2714_c0_g2~~TRINITY_DN2714_c0_g2_i3.p1  ORF type:complete len:593 (-),score=166.54 TRINITY_DN2714_c0_g2_i3:236-2014(-)
MLLALVAVILVLCPASVAEAYEPREQAIASTAAVNVSPAKDSKRRLPKVDGHMLPHDAHHDAQWNQEPQQEVGAGLVPAVLEACDAFMRSLKKKYGWQMKPLFRDAWYDLPDGGRAVKQRLLHAIVYQRNFTMAFTGISNTAGHDNRITESYPMVLEQLFKPVLQLAGVNFRVLNGAMGNTDFLPYSYCVEAHAGAHPDVVSWEMSMQIGNTPCTRTAELMETWLRTALALPSRPVPLLLNCQADRGRCARDREAPTLSHTMEKAVGRCVGAERTRGTLQHDLMSWYKDYGIHSLNLETLMAAHTCGYPAFEKKKLYGGKVGTPRTKSWHPGPGAHRLMAEVLAANYIGLLRGALSELDAAAPGVTLQELQDVAYREKLSQLLNLDSDGASAAAAKLHDPSYCTQRQCVEAGSYRCLTTYYPNQDASTQLDRYVTNNTTLDRKPHFKYLPTNMSEWQIIVNEPMRGITGFQFDNPQWPIDRKWVLAGAASAGPLNFKFEVTELPDGRTAPVVVCRQVPPQQTPSEIHAQPPYTLDNMVLSLDGQRASAKRPSPRENCWQLDQAVGRGSHVLTVRANYAPSMLVRISHLIVPR